jgi:ATP-dependent Clp protease ATP-binding subunit ClpA
VFERFTKPARRIVVLAGGEAGRLGDERIGDEHLRLAMLHRDVGLAGAVLAHCGVTARAADLALAAVRRGRRPGQAAEAGEEESTPRDDADATALRTIGIDLAEVRRRAEETFGPGALERGSAARRRGHIPFGKDAKRVLELSLRQAVRMRSGHVGSEHVLLGVLDNDKAAVAVLRAMEISPGDVRAQLLAEIGQEAV